jgi:hypothetical protein
MVQHLLLHTPAIPVLAMVVAGLIGNRLYDRHVQLSNFAFTMIGVTLIASIVGDALTLESASRWLLIASLSVTFASIGLVLTAGRDQPFSPDKRAD